jgi:diaminohydroxyphosphoribosylaminopyrimidine deaminase / 5-amino-6-(5-phosphoribosylamino)uracil reductase
MNDSGYIQRCIDLARIAGKKNKSNPQVGCVIVHNQRIIGEGYHEYFGGPHAEINAIDNISKVDKILLSESTLYVTLEPCNHSGKTRPCSSAIVNAGIKKVIIGCVDSNPLVIGGGIFYLQKNNVDTQLLNNTDCLSLIRPFVANQNERPYIILKWAQSEDRYIGNDGQKTWLTNPTTSILTHKWRSEVDAILIGKNTVTIDNPSLGVRHYPGDNPIRILLDSNLNIKQKNILDDGKPTIIFNTIKNALDGQLNYIKVENMSDLSIMMKTLFSLGIFQMIVEGGRQILESFIQQNLWDEARVITTPNKLSTGIQAPTIFGEVVKRFSVHADKIEILYPINSDV